MTNEYHKLGKKYEEILQLSSVIEDAPYILTEGSNSLSCSVVGIGDSCKSRSSKSSSPCRASSLESKSKSE